MAQPRNLMGGHIISAIIGVATYKIFHNHMWLAASVAVATAIAAMHATKTLHPPGGATSLIAVIGSQKIHNLGFLYVVIPAGLGAAIMLAVALSLAVYFTQVARNQEREVKAANRKLAAEIKEHKMADEVQA